MTTSSSSSSFSDSEFFNHLASNVNSLVRHGSTLLSTRSSFTSEEPSRNVNGQTVSTTTDQTNDDPHTPRVSLLQQVNDKIRQLRGKEQQQHHRDSNLNVDLEASNGDDIMANRDLLESMVFESDDDGENSIDVTTAFLQNDRMHRMETHGNNMNANDATAAASGGGGGDGGGGGGVLSGLWKSVSDRFVKTGPPPPPLPPPEPSASASSTVLGRISSGARTLGTRMGIVAEEPPEPMGWRDAFSQELNSWITLNKTQRMYGFVICLIIGIILIGISAVFLPYIVFMAPVFAFLYTMGNVFCLLSTFFIVGPIAQLKNMVSLKRIIPSTVYIVSMLMTLLVAIKLQNFVLVIIFIVLQIVSLAWYILSYIPFGQQVFTTAFRTMFRAAF